MIYRKNCSTQAESSCERNYYEHIFVCLYIPIKLVRNGIDYMIEEHFLFVFVENDWGNQCVCELYEKQFSKNFGAKEIHIQEANTIFLFLISIQDIPPVINLQIF